MFNRYTGPIRTGDYVICIASNASYHYALFKVKKEGMRLTSDQSYIGAILTDIVDWSDEFTIDINDDGETLAIRQSTIRAVFSDETTALNFVADLSAQRADFNRSIRK